MEQATHRQMSESFRLGAALALIGGFLDAYTYLIRDGVLTNAQAGNTALLGTRLMEGGQGDAGHYLAPILAFTTGVLAAELVRGRPRGVQALHRRQITMTAELLLLAMVAFLSATLDNAVDVLAAFVCMVQAESFRKVNDNVSAIAMCTGNLHSGMERLYLWGKTDEWGYGHWVTRYYGIIVFFIVGVVLGVWCSDRRGRRMVPGAHVLFLATFLFMSQHEPLARTGKGA